MHHTESFLPQQCILRLYLYLCPVNDEVNIRGVNNEKENHAAGYK